MSDREWITLDEFIEERERDPEMARLMREARKRIAPLLYRPGDPRYERMMRGEGPPRGEENRCSVVV